MSKAKSNTPPLPLSVGSEVNYRNGTAGLILTVSAKGDAPIYSQDEAGRVIAHRPDGRVSERVDGPYDITPAKRTVTVVTQLYRADGGELMALARLNGHKPAPLHHGWHLVTEWINTYAED
jgi:hypothetical protein